ncbi:hypothetical protein MFLO_06957 [Listeria floridensis FSL S10-1187]|uniref:Uncharacterized protein n=1 Tax=Listeria floridensis FSL S10-1187 TaxID=1265817 RepID=A0ABN0RFS3_9LIST|nr:hypothetical protein [Listeria floridensis]EUJ32439.1 hypothetical protein MFLO_06957 [Listeria floridensis FSL S10-1187]
MINRVTSNELKIMYSLIDELYIAEESIPQKVFKGAVSTYVFDLEDFMDHGLKDILGLSKYENAQNLVWLPHISVPGKTEIIELELNQNLEDFGDCLQRLWDGATLFLLLDYGCLFNDKKNWIIHFSIELQVAVLGIFSKEIDVKSRILSTPYSKETFFKRLSRIP